MRGIWLGIGVCLAIGGCAYPPGTAPPNAVTASGTDGSIGEIALRGQVVASPPGTEAAVAEVQRTAAARCGGGFTIRSLRTTAAPPTSTFLYHVQSYEAVVDCNPRPSDGGAR